MTTIRTGRPSPALAVAFVALFVALSGTALALKANSVKSRHIVDGAVRSVDVKDDDLTGVDIDESTLVNGGGPPSGPAGGDLTGTYPNPNIGTGQVDSSRILDSSVAGADVAADTLTGSDIDERTLRVRNLGCQTGKVLGFARVKGSASMPTTYTSSSTYADVDYNCSGESVEVRRACRIDGIGDSVCKGWYFVRFTDNFSGVLAVASSNFESSNDARDNFVAVRRVNSGPDFGAFEVQVTDEEGFHEDGWLNIFVY